MTKGQRLISQHFHLPPRPTFIINSSDWQCQLHVQENNAVYVLVRYKQPLCGLREFSVSPSVSLLACSSLRKCKILWILSALLIAFIYLFIYFAEFSTRCYNCSRNLRGAQCGSCKSFGLQCVICHVAVRGESQKKFHLVCKWHCMLRHTCNYL